MVSIINQYFILQLSLWLAFETYFCLKQKKLITVTKTYLPPFERYEALIKEAYDKGWVTNNGQLVQRLEQELKAYLNVANLFFCTNGTITLQIALKVLGIKGDVITTPFSYVATTNSILWEGCNPVFADIQEQNFCIDPNLIEQKITSNTTAILATHVYGLPCDISAIEKIAAKHNLKVIYDAAHAFGSKYNSQSLLKFGDISSCSFHATKLFHTVEGGCLVTDNSDTARAIYLARQFGHVYDDYFSVGINAKNSEFHAAMGLAVLPDINLLINTRKKIDTLYRSYLDSTKIQIIQYPANLEPNYAYFPIVLESEEIMFQVKNNLEQNQIFPRRYFFPSLNKLPFIPYQECPISEKMAARVLCLPVYFELTEDEIVLISNIVNRSV